MFDPTTQTYSLSGNDLAGSLTLSYTQLQEFCTINNLKIDIFVGMAGGEDKRKTYKGYSISLVENARN